MFLVMFVNQILTLSGAGERSKVELSFVRVKVVYLFFINLLEVNLEAFV